MSCAASHKSVTEVVERKTLSFRWKTLSFRCLWFRDGQNELFGGHEIFSRKILLQFEVYIRLERPTLAADGRL